MEIYIDHVNWVKVFDHGMGYEAKVRQEMWEELRQLATQRRGRVTLQWLPSHLDKEEKRRKLAYTPKEGVVLGKFLADRLAGMGARLEQLDKTEVVKMEELVAKTKLVLLRIAAAVEMTAREAGKAREEAIRKAKQGRKEAREAKAREAGAFSWVKERNRSKHTLRLVGTGSRTHWRCTECLVQHRSGDEVLMFFRSGCPGKETKQERGGPGELAGAASQGSKMRGPHPTHRLVAAGEALACIKCGASGITCLRKLAAPCKRCPGTPVLQAARLKALAGGDFGSTTLVVERGRPQGLP